MISLFKKALPVRVRRSLEVFLMDHGFPVTKKRGTRGVQQLGHRGYVGSAELFDEVGRLQYEFLLKQGLQPFHVLCDIGCGSLRGGRYFLEYLDKGHYLGLEGEQQLVELAILHEINKDIYEAKTPEFVFSYSFEFDRFSRSPDFALAVSVFSHLTETDIRLCLENLAERVLTSCQLFASFFEVQRPYPNFKLSHPHLGFHYTREQIERLGREAGWSPRYIGEWGSLRNQKMMHFVISRI
jgi:hypothetical protein